LTEAELALSPNPASETVEVSFSNALRGKVAVRLINVSGVEVGKYDFQKTTDTFRQSLPVKHLPSGSYFLDLQMQNYSHRKRLVKQ
jgi:hypothetical protein